jgi:hypothetical protein
LILADENTRVDQRTFLLDPGFPARQVGDDWGSKGMSDGAILAALRSSRRVTFLTRDGDFYKAGFRTRHSASQ